MVFTATSSAISTGTPETPETAWKQMEDTIRSWLDDFVYSNENHFNTLESCFNLVNRDDSKITSLPKLLDVPKVMIEMGIVTSCILVTDAIVAPYNLLRDLQSAFTEFDWEGSDVFQIVHHLVWLPATIMKSAALMPLRTFVKYMAVNVLGLITMVDLAVAVAESNAINQLPSSAIEFIERR